MKLTVNEVYGCLVALREVSAQPLPVKGALPLRRTLRKLRDEVTVLEETRTDIAEREDETDKTKAFEEFGNEELELNLESICICDLGDFRVSPDNLDFLIQKGVLKE